MLAVSPMPIENTSVPCAMRWPNGVVFTNSASMWCGKKSPVWPAWTTKSVSVMVRPLVRRDAPIS